MTCLYGPQQIPLPELPKLPEEVDADFKYAVVHYGVFTTSLIYLTYLHNTAFYFESGDRYYFGGTDEQPVPCYRTRYNEETGAWDELSYTENNNVKVGAEIGSSGSIIWANFTVYNKDGSIYLEKSEPVPVSPVKINPALLVQSFFVGQALRRSRK